jgi:serine/threonine protein kinase
MRAIRPFSLPKRSLQKLTVQLLTALSFLASQVPRERRCPADPRAPLPQRPGAPHGALNRRAGVMVGRQGVIHADLRPENVLLREGVGEWDAEAPPVFKVKLADFGNAFRASEAGAYHDDFELQTLSYRAPEVLFGLPFDTQIDMWSLGCLLVEVYIGRRVFDSFNRPSTVAAMARTLVRSPPPRASATPRLRAPAAGRARLTARAGPLRGSSRAGGSRMASGSTHSRAVPPPLPPLSPRRL